MGVASRILIAALGLVVLAAMLFLPWGEHRGSPVEPQAAPQIVDERAELVATDLSAPASRVDEAGVAGPTESAPAPPSGRCRCLLDAAALEWMQSEVDGCEHPEDTLVGDLERQPGSEQIDREGWLDLRLLQVVAPNVRLSVSEALWLLENQDSLTGGAPVRRSFPVAFADWLDGNRPTWREGAPRWPEFLDESGKRCLPDVRLEVELDDEPSDLDDLLYDAGQFQRRECCGQFDERYRALRRQLILCRYSADTLVGDLLRRGGAERVYEVPGGWGTLERLQEDLCPQERFTVDEAVLLAEAWQEWTMDEYAEWLDTNHPGWRSRN